MSFYRFHFESSGGQQVVLPSSLDKTSSIEELEAFAKDNGIDTSDWDYEDQRKFARKFFDHVVLQEVEGIGKPFSEINWRPFRKALEEEPSLFDYPWPVFKNRIQSGLLSAIIDEDNNVIGTINVVPKLTAELRQHLNIEHVDPDNPPQVFETGAGWIDKRYRSVGLYGKLRNILLEETKSKGRLLFSQASGVGASYRNIKDGYALVNWNEYPFAAVLLGWLEPTNGGGLDVPRQFRLAAGKVIDLPPAELYTDKTRRSWKKDGSGPTNLSYFANRDFSIDHKLWVNDLDKLKRFESNLRHQLGLSDYPTFDVLTHALARWKDRVAKALFHDSDLLSGSDRARRVWSEFSDNPVPEGILPTNSNGEDGPIDGDRKLG